MIQKFYMKSTEILFPEHIESNYTIFRIYFRLPPETGGMENHILHLSNEQRNLGYNVINIYNVGDSKYNSIKILPKFNLNKIKFGFIRNIFFYFSILLKKNEILTHKNIILHIHGDWSDFLLSKFLAIYLKPKIKFASIHDNIKIVKFLIKFALKGFDEIFTTGKKEQLYLEKILKKKIHHIPSSPVNDFFKFKNIFNNHIYDLITIANNTRKKRLDIILDCAIKRPIYNFLIIGKDIELIQDKINMYNIKNVTLLNYSNTNNIIKYLSDSKLFLLTSEYEGTPTVFLEALTIGLPIITTPSNDYSWLIKSNFNGVVTDSWNTNEIVKDIDFYLKDNNFLKQCFDYNKNSSKNFSWLNTAMFIRKLIKNYQN
jgi:glycosyltransferase involved in cell wall biosynthesis